MSEDVKLFSKEIDDIKSQMLDMQMEIDILKETINVLKPANKSQKEETIIGHFLICYLSVLLTRLLQIHVLKDKYGTEELFDFIRDFRVVKVSERKYTNLTRSSSFTKELSVQTGMPLTSYFLGKEGINKMLSHRF